MTNKFYLYKCNEAQLNNVSDSSPSPISCTHSKIVAHVLSWLKMKCYINKKKKIYYWERRFLCCSDDPKKFNSNVHNFCIQHWNKKCTFKCIIFTEFTHKHISWLKTCLVFKLKKVKIRMSLIFNWRACSRITTLPTIVLKMDSINEY